MVGVACAGVAGLHTAVARAVDRVGITVVVLTLLAACNVTLDLLLIPRMGIAGAAVATTIAFAVSGFVYLPFFNRVPNLAGPSARRRYITLLGFAAPTAFSVAAFLIAAPAFRLAWCAGILAGNVLLARACGIFTAGSLQKLQTVRMPRMARTLVCGFYGLMGARP